MDRIMVPHPERRDKSDIRSLCGTKKKKTTPDLEVRKLGERGQIA